MVHIQLPLQMLQIVQTEECACSPCTWRILEDTVSMMRVSNRDVGLKAGSAEERGVELWNGPKRAETST
jgi:hypothetical protein